MSKVTDWMPKPGEKFYSYNRYNDEFVEHTCVEIDEQNLVWTDEDTFLYPCDVIGPTKDWKRNALMMISTKELIEELQKRTEY